jgi:homoserine O-acetyltransferase/O-succinyltransferase
MPARASTLAEEDLSMRRVIVSAVSAVALGVLVTGGAAAHRPDQPPHQRFAMGDLQLESGEVIRDFAISYVTHGTLNAKRSNAILMVTALTGNHHRLDFMIGPGRALDTDRYFVICTDAIGNGLTTSPSTSTVQPRMKFPRFAIRDMVRSQHRLLTEHLKIDHVVAVVGPSMGGMQALQWGVSHPKFMDSLVALVPLARTPAWSIVATDTTRQAIMLDPAWAGGDYTAPPEKGIRLWRQMLTFIAARTPEWYRYEFAQPGDVLPWVDKQLAPTLRAFDANDYIYQSWAYDVHDVGTTPGMNGDYVRALRAIEAKTLVMIGTKDLLNPEWEPVEAARYIRDVRVSTIRPESVTGHYAAGGFIPADVEVINAEVGQFLDVVTQRGARLK